MTDRECIASKGNSTFVYSAVDIISCCDICGEGCNGGQPPMAWKYWLHYGVVSGGAFESSVGCRPYPFTPCRHSREVVRERERCGRRNPTPRCETSCQRGYSVPYGRDRRYGKTVYSVKANQYSIMREIMANGPVEASFSVYEDFPNYKSGVYQHVSTNIIGGHAVKIIGWGVEDGTPYWLVNNSWNDEWGASGTFKIIRGTDESGIEANISAGLPRL